MNRAAIREARDLLAMLTRVPPTADAIGLEQDKKERAVAEQRLWSWYLEWSAIARVVVKERALLRRLGFSPRERKRDVNDSEAADESDHRDGVPPAR